MPEARSKFYAPSKIPVFIAGAIVLAMALGWFLIEPKAEIEIWPQKEPVNFDIDAIVYIKGGRGDILGEILEVNKSVSGNFLSSATKLKTAKASGTIRVYNAYSTTAQPLIPNTRFVSGDGKLFRITEWITVPGAHYEGSKLIPGIGDVLVTADQPGEEYNIGPSTFSLPGLVGTAAYTAIYAKSSEAMSGGMSQEILQVTQGDIDKAEAELTKRFFEESKRALGEMLPMDDFIILEDAIEGEIINFAPLAKVGDEASEFFAQADGRSKAFVFKKSAVYDFAKNYILSQMPAGKALQENSLNMEYTIKNIAIKRGTMSLALRINGNLYTLIDEQAMKGAVADKKSDEIAEILKTYSQIEKAKVDLWPLWVEGSPSKIDQINIRINLD